jgi:Oxygen-sensitive ribonucleoside-triphosphate reductase
MTTQLIQLIKIPVEKRSGFKTKFYPYKIEFVLDKLDLSQSQQDNLIENLVSKFIKLDSITTKQIRQVITDNLMTQNLIQAAKSYQDYFINEQEKFSRATNVKLNIEKLFNRNEQVVHENANKDSNIFNTQRDLEAGVASKALGLKMLPDIVAKAHLRGDIHWHDLDYSPVTPETNCCLIDFNEMLTNGFKIGNAWVSSPKSIQTATAQMSQIIANVASLQYGGCSANRIDQLLAPFAELNYQKHLKDAQKWIAVDKQVEFAREKLKKIFMMLCKRSNTKSILFIRHRDKRRLRRLISVWGRVGSNVLFKNLF